MHSEHQFVQDSCLITCIQSFLCQLEWREKWLNLLYYSEENSLLNNTSVCSIMTYTSTSATVWLGIVCLWAKQRILNLPWCLRLLCSVCGVQYFNDVLPLFILCPFTAEGEKRTDCLSSAKDMSHRSNCLLLNTSTHNISFTCWLVCYILISLPVIYLHCNWASYFGNYFTYVVKWKTNVAILATLLLLG